MKILCADIGGTSIKAGMVDEKGYVTDFRETPTESQKGGPQVMLNLFSLLEGYSDYDCIGISTAGQVDAQNGVIIYANENIPRYTGMRVKEMLEKRFGKPVKMENDVNCAGLGEAYFGAGKDTKDLICLTYGTGIGGSVILDRRIHGGKNGIAGEFGHMLTHPEGRDCNCGKKGCYESYASATALVREARKVHAEYGDGRRIFKEINEGSGPLRQVLNDWAREVAYGLVNIIHIFNPELIVLGGGILEQETALEAIRVETNRYIMDSFKEVRLEKATLGNKAGLLGAAALHLYQ